MALPAPVACHWGASHNEDEETQPPLILVPVTLKDPSVWSCPPLISGRGIKCGFDPSCMAETPALQRWASPPKVREHCCALLLTMHLNRAKHKGGPIEFLGPQGFQFTLHLWSG